jgi:tetratricopeptide (TPR) repeat protein
MTSISLGQFVGRQQEIEYFEDLLFYQGPPTWILHLFGSGGMGKTTLLRQYQAICQQRGAPHTRLIDFYDLRYYSHDDILNDIIQDLGFGYFDDFVYQEKPFNDCLNRVAAEHYDRTGLKTVLFFDTCEQAPDTVLRWLLDELLLDLQYVVAVLAGRTQLLIPAERRQEFLLHPLDGLSRQEARAYFEQLGLDLESTVADELWRLSAGVPINLALAADWMKYDETPEHLLDLPSETFARSLVMRFNDLAEPRNKAVAYMGHLYHRFDGDFFAHVYQGEFPLSPHEAEAILQELHQKFRLIKYRETAHSYQLHDEARRLVQRYILSQESPDLLLRLSRAAVDYYLSRDELASTTPSPKVAEWLYHELYLDAHFDSYRKLFPDDARSPHQGYQLFSLAADAALSTGRLADCERLLSVITSREFRDKFKDADFPDISIKRGRFLIRDPRFREEARELLHRALTYRITSGQRLEVLGTLGFFSGGEEALRYLHQAADEARGLAEGCRPASRARRRWLDVLARNLNNLGQVYRRRGDWEQAAIYYQQALDVWAELPNSRDKLRHVAHIRNNLAYVYRLWGDLYKSDALCKLALSTLIELGEPGPLAFSYHTYGEIYKDMGLYTEAEEYLQKALEKFQEARADLRHVGRTYVDLANIARRTHRPDDADMYYDQAMAIFLERDITEGQIEALNEHGCELRKRGKERGRRGRRALDQGQAEEGQRLLAEARAILQEAGDCLARAGDLMEGGENPYRWADNRADMCLLRYYQLALAETDDEREALKKQIRELADEVMRIADEHNHPLFGSNVTEILGGIAYDEAVTARQTHDDATASDKFRQAFAYYAQACASLADYYPSPSERYRRGFHRVLRRLLGSYLSPTDVDEAYRQIARKFELERKDAVGLQFLDACRRIRDARGEGGEREGLWQEIARKGTN